GSLSLTTVRLLARRLSAENHADLLAAAAGKGKREVEEMLAHRFPEPDMAASVRQLPVRTVEEASATPSPSTAANADVAMPVATSTVTTHEGATPPSPAPGTSSAMPARPAVVRPLAPARYEIRFTATGETRDRLRRAQDLLSHAIPSGDI